MICKCEAVSPLWRASLKAQLSLTSLRLGLGNSKSSDDYLQWLLCSTQMLLLLPPPSAQLFLVSACRAQLASLLRFQGCSSVVFRKHNTRDFSCNFSCYFSQRMKNGPSFSGSPCKLSPVLDNSLIPQKHSTSLISGALQSIR